MHLLLPILSLGASLVAQMVKLLPTMRDTPVRSLGREDPLEKEMATHSSIHAWKIPWTEETGGYSPWSLKESDTTEQLHFTFTSYLPCTISLSLILLHCHLETPLHYEFVKLAPVNPIPPLSQYRSSTTYTTCSIPPEYS